MENFKRVVITGAAGQDGLILALKLSATGHHVIGIVKDAEQKTFLASYNFKNLG
jgi:GDP-D-mannose dehydratase